LRFSHEKIALKELPHLRNKSVLPDIKPNILFKRKTSLQQITPKITSDIWMKQSQSHGTLNQLLNVLRIQADFHVGNVPSYRARTKS